MICQLTPIKKRLGKLTKQDIDAGGSDVSVSAFQRRFSRNESFKKFKY